MSGTRRRQQVLSDLDAARTPRGDQGACRQGPPANADVIGTPAYLQALELRLRRASSVAALYDDALADLRYVFPSACIIALDVDAEQITARPSSAQASSTATARAIARIERAPVQLAGIAPSDRRPGAEPDPLQDVLRDSLGLARPAIGRIHLGELIVTLLVLDHRPPRIVTRDEHCALQRVADLISTQAETILDSFFADLAREPLPIA